MMTVNDASKQERPSAQSTSLLTFAPWIAAILLLLVLPQIFTSRTALTVMNQMSITIVFALSYNMLLGQGGMLSFGHAVYMGMGGFFAVHVMNMVEFDGLPLPLPLLPLFGGLFGMAFAAIIGSFSTRRAGTVFAMISLGVGELIASSSVIVVAFFGGEEGVSGDRTEGPRVFGLNFASHEQVYYLLAAWLVISALAMFLYSRTPIGRITNAVRDNEERAEFLGYSQRMVRFMSFCAAGFFAGIAGGLFAINYEILTEENLNLATSGSILLITFLGGVGFFIGPIIGAIVFTLLQSCTQPLYGNLAALCGDPVRVDRDVLSIGTDRFDRNAYPPVQARKTGTAAETVSHSCHPRGGFPGSLHCLPGNPVSRPKRFRWRRGNDVPGNYLQFAVALAVAHHSRHSGCSILDPQSACVGLEGNLG